MIVEYVKRKDDDFSEYIFGEISKKRRSMSNYEENRSRLILEFQTEGSKSLKGVEAWVEKEMEEVFPRKRTSARTNVERFKRNQTTVTKKRKCLQQKAPISPRTLPVHIDQTIQGLSGGVAPPLWLGSKSLTDSDINPHLARLLLPRCDDAYLRVMDSEEQKNVLVTKYRNQGMNVKVVDPRGEVWDLDFKYWKSFEGYVLTGKNWNKLVDKNSLNPGTDMVHVWCFRSLASAQLGFAINIERN